jgi:maltose alpha-D-glucosyltransferase/alpha-amylase
MQWNNEPNAGFSTASQDKLYLPIDPDIYRPTVYQQEEDPNSLLNRVRKLISIRKSNSGLQASAGFKLLYAHPGVYPLVFERGDEIDRYIIAINPSGQTVKSIFPAFAKQLPVTVYGPEDVFVAQDDNWKIVLPGRTGGIYQTSSSN